ncbi:MAG: hypothetical protein KC591_09425 [Gemmatimonadetes bacterium]|nr:hypothetical protein [Gemmatimonadota bacterium]
MYDADGHVLGNSPVLVHINSSGIDITEYTDSYGLAVFTIAGADLQCCADNVEVLLKQPPAGMLSRELDLEFDSSENDCGVIPDGPINEWDFGDGTGRELGCDGFYLDNYEWTLWIAYIDSSGCAGGPLNVQR